MFIKKFMSMLLLTATISMTVAVPGHAAMKITDAPTSGVRPAVNGKLLTVQAILLQAL